MLLTFGCFYESHITGKVSYHFPANQAWGNHVHVLERSVRAGRLWYEEMIIEFRLINLPNFLNFSVSSVYFLFYSEAATGGVLLRKDVLRNIAKFTGKHLCRSLYFNKVVGVSFVFTRCSVFLIEKKVNFGGKQSFAWTVVYHYYLCFVILHQSNQFLRNKNLTTKTAVTEEFARRQWISVLAFLYSRFS